MIQQYFNHFSQELKDVLPNKLLYSLLELVMKNNIFKFGDTWWQQINGTAMGTPCACIYATIFFGFYERTLLLSKNKESLLLYKRQIDDIFIIWQPTSPNNDEWTLFKNDLNNCSSLSWETEDLGSSTTFLDLNIWIDSNTNKIKYSTYQKAMNLFLYIPKHSAHPKHSVKSLIFGLLKTYKRQNPTSQDFQNMSIQLFKRLRARGHQHYDLKEIFKDTLNKINLQRHSKQNKPSLLHNNNNIQKRFQTKKHYL